jgi:curved DNA-binding protein CbpA
MAAASDPYKVLGVSPQASEDQLRYAYRQLVRIHHPDHNHGSAESARRFEEVQEAYARIRSLRARAPSADPPPPPAYPEVEDRLADLEQQVRRARAARERARRAAAEAAANQPPRPSDEELGYVRTDDSFSKILADAEAELSKRLDGAPDHPAARRVRRLIDDFAAKLRGEDSSGASH